LKKAGSTLAIIAADGSFAAWVAAGAGAGRRELTPWTGWVGDTRGVWASSTPSAARIDTAKPEMVRGFMPHTLPQLSLSVRKVRSPRGFRRQAEDLRGFRLQAEGGV
jgi:hypothetical protein